jgi:lactoylglutathione lyase
MRINTHFYLVLFVSIFAANQIISGKPHSAPAFSGLNDIRKEDNMRLGLRTVVYHVEDLERAKNWYTKAFGVKPYFDEDFYVGFDIGGYELGLHPDMEGVTRGNNAVAYWGVEDIESAYRHMLEIGARKDSPIRDVGGDIKVAQVRDPFGNVVGLIQNPHFKKR